MYRNIQPKLFPVLEQKTSFHLIQIYFVTDLVKSNVFIPSPCEILLTSNRSSKRYIYDTFSQHRKRKNFRKIETEKRISRQVSFRLVEAATMAQSSRREFPTWISKRQAASKASALADKRISAGTACLAH